MEHTKHFNVQKRLKVPHDVDGVEQKGQVNSSTYLYGTMRVFRALSKATKIFKKALQKTFSKWVGRTYPCVWDGEFDSGGVFEMLPTFEDQAASLFINIITNQSNMRQVVCEKAGTRLKICVFLHH